MSGAERRTAFPNDVLTVSSEQTGFDYEISIEVPNRYQTSDKAYPMVICLDGQWTFGAIRDAFRILPMSRELPEAVVVGVAHADADVREILQKRAIDFTPTQYQAPTATGVRVGGEAVGKADRFRRFLVDTVVPMVADRYRTSDDKTLVGHSFSGLFGVDTLFTEPSAFDRWVLASPSVWWDEQVIFRREQAHAEATEDLPARVFMSVGALEGGDDVGFGGHQAFHDQLAARDYPSLDMTWQLFGGETHQSVISTAVVTGLRTIFR